MHTANQTSCAVHFEWGLAGLLNVDAADWTVIVVDVLSFSTSVSIAVSRGAVVFPCPWRDSKASQFALDNDAVLASGRSHDTSAFSLSPASLLHAFVGLRLVLPSPNGSNICSSSPSPRTLAGALRNRSAVARFARTLGPPYLVIAAGEHWSDGSFRPCLEDFLGAGGVLSLLPGTRSPESAAAEAAFLATSDLRLALLSCASGLELCARGFPKDVELAAAVDQDHAAPILRDGHFVAA